MDVLFVGATRPAMRFGVTYVALLANAVLTFEAFLVTKNLLVLLVFVPVHAVSALLCARDPRIFELALLWLRTGLPGRLRGGRRWGASSYGALELDFPDGRGRRRAPVVLPRACAP